MKKIVKKHFNYQKLIELLIRREKELIQQRRELEFQARIVRKILQSIDLDELLDYILN
jgi:hypothetical protein